MKRKSIWQNVLLVTLVLATSALVAQEATVKVDVYPPESEIFVDGKAWGDGTSDIKMASGTHTITVYNYGFAAQTREVSLKDGDNTSLEFRLQPSGDRVSGPWGRLQIEDARDAAVFLNGSTHGYFVGHSDMFNNNNGWLQTLIVPVGKHQVSIVKHDGGQIWAGEVNVEANKRVIIHTASGEITVKDWPGGSNEQTLPRFAAGIASANVVVAPVTAKFVAEPTRINCGDTTRLTWSTQDAVDSNITGNSVSLGELPVSGERSEQPKENTDYQFRTAGPGGVLTSNASVEVNTVVQSNFGAAPAEVRYHRMGDKVVEHTPTTLSWTTSNADAASIDSIGTVNTNGDQAVKPVPKQATNGPVDESATYTLVAKNACGGSDTHTATVHITGMIEPVPEVPLASVFFPTGYPEVKHPQIGLVRSQHDVLAKTAAGLKKYLIYDPDARISLAGHADVRDSAKMNQSLSERRVNRVKACLVSQGIPADKIDVVALGEKENLDRATVLALHKGNPQHSSFAKRNSQALVWAYNRRVDITLLPTGQKSTQFFPGETDDAKLIFRSDWQSRQAVERAGEGMATEPATSGAGGAQ